MTSKYSLFLSVEETQEYLKLGMGVFSFDAGITSA